MGAGAAGLLAAISAARGGAPVVLLETRARPGAKIRVSGGGRCNVLPVRVSPEDFHGAGSPHALRNVLLSWPLAQVRAFFERDLGVPLVDEPFGDSGKVFPRSDDAREIVAALLGECERLGVELRAPFRVERLDRVDDGFELESDAGERLRARRVALATGGLSLPKTGSDGTGWRLARALGHSLAPTYPALVPLTTGDERFRELAGVSLPAVLAARRGGRVEREHAGDFLFTHRGFSGPVVLDASYHRTRPGGDEVELLARWSTVPSWDELLRRGGRGTVAGLLREHLPRRLALLLTELSGAPAERRLSELARGERERLTAVLERLPLPLSGDEGYRTAEVTGGGVPLSEVVLKTLESRLAPGLHLCGEMLDVTGRLGGFNFLWAWVTGRRVGLALAAAHVAGAR